MITVTYYTSEPFGTQESEVCQLQCERDFNDFVALVRDREFKTISYNWGYGLSIDMS